MEKISSQAHELERGHLPSCTAIHRQDSTLAILVATAPIHYVASVLVWASTATIGCSASLPRQRDTSSGRWTRAISRLTRGKTAEQRTSTALAVEIAAVAPFPCAESIPVFSAAGTVGAVCFVTQAAALVTRAISAVFPR
jgi:hypothetical protein